jgi:hypothetical protein
MHHASDLASKVEKRVHLFAVRSHPWPDFNPARVVLSCFVWYFAGYR